MCIVDRASANLGDDLALYPTFVAAACRYVAVVDICIRLKTHTLAKAHTRMGPRSACTARVLGVARWNAVLRGTKAAHPLHLKAASPSSQLMYAMRQDPDLRALRERREWLDTTGAAVGGVSSRSLVSARTELRAPLRLVRLWASGGLALGAGIGLVIITGRLISSLRGAPHHAHGAWHYACILDFVSGPGV